MDYYINDKNTLSAYTNQSFTSGFGTGLTTVAFDNPIANRNTNQSFGSDGKNKKDSRKGRPIRLQAQQDFA